MKYKRLVFELTPLGKADKEVRGFLEQRLPEHQMKRYRKSLNTYRSAKLVQSSLKVLLYAGLITSIAATVGLQEPAGLVQQIASYFGTSLIFILFSVSSYITMIRRENYHVQREILISEAANSDLEL